jgi:hypothetical protein
VVLVKQTKVGCLLKAVLELEVASYSLPFMCEGQSLCHVLSPCRAHFHLLDCTALVDLVLDFDRSAHRCRMSLLSALPAPSTNLVLPTAPVAPAVASNQLSAKAEPPPYGRRKGFVPRKADDFGGGGEVGHSPCFVLVLGTAF